MAFILVADGHAPTRELLAERLHAEGYSPICFADPATAYERFAEGGIEILLLALDLPLQEGEHLARRIRRADGQTPILIYDCGHRGTPRGVQAILSLGANAYLPDPTVQSELRQKLKLLARPPPSAPQSILGEDSEQLIDEGALALGILPRLLLAAQAASRNGAIFLIQGPIERRLYLLEGELVGYTSSSRRETLGPWLVGQGRVSEAGYQSALELMAETKLSATAALVELGAIEAGDELYQLLLEHAQTMIQAAFGITQGRFRVMASERLAREVPPLSLPMLPMIRAGAHDHFPVKFFHQRLEDKMEAYPYRSAEFGRRLNTLGLSPKELAEALKISGEVTTRELLQLARSDLKRTLLLLWLFLRTGVIAFSEQRRASEDSGPYKALILGRRKLSPLPPSLKEALTEEALQIVTSSYFGALGLDISAEVDEVEEAFHERATRFHPESYAEYDLCEIEDLLGTVLDRINAAYRVLSVPDKRKAYLAFLLSRHESAFRSGPISVEAEIVLRRGIKAMADRDWASAEQAFLAAVSANPREPEYQCYLAFAQFKSAHGPAAQRASDARKLLKRALSLDPKMEHALVLLGVMEEERGDPRAARRHFLKALKLNPKSLTARMALQRLDHVAADLNSPTDDPS